jgi:peptidoglycan/LPS O-acetylase OafA/YrhL
MDRYAKAVVGALIAGLGVLELALADNVVTPTEWTRVIGTVLGALVLVWAVPNERKRPEPPTESGRYSSSGQWTSDQG